MIARSRRRLGPCAALLLALAPAAAAGLDEMRPGGPPAERLLLRATVVETVAGVERAREALGEPRSARELDRRLARAVESGLVAPLASADRATAYSIPLKLELPDGSSVEVRPLDRTRPRRIRTLVRERREGSPSSRVVEIPLDRSTALPTGALVVPLGEGERLLALRVEVRP